VTKQILKLLLFTTETENGSSESFKGLQLMVLDNQVSCDKELTEDFLAIIAILVAKHHGQ
jgi:hypothetical protein